MVRRLRSAAVQLRLCTGIVGVVCAASPGAAQSNVCATAPTIGTGTFSGTTAGATADGTVGCANQTTSPDVWYKFVSPSAGMLDVSTCTQANYDTVLSLHTACPGTAANQLDCNDDHCNSRSRVLTQVSVGQTVYIRVGGFNGAAGTYTLTVGVSAIAPDAMIGDLTEMTQLARSGSDVAASIGSPLCNAGTAPLDTFRAPDFRHPLYQFNAYRLESGGTRLVQIGQSWTKHNRGVAQDNDCGGGCPVPWPDFTRLGAGCSDVYTAVTSGTQAFMGPRTEVNPFTGVFTYAGSYMALGTPASSVLERRMRLADSDLNAAQHPGALYYAEYIVVCHDDANHLNNVTHERIGVSGSPGGTWTFNANAAAPVYQPTITAWPGAATTAIQPAALDDGRCLLAEKVTNNGNGTWRYEYALFNHTMDRGVWSLQVPVGAAAVTGAGFSAVRSFDEPFSNDAWTIVRAGNVLKWHTRPYAVDPHSNPLRWGTMYNFWFDASTPPTASQAVLGLYKPGASPTVSGVVSAPAVPCPADFDGSGGIEPADIAGFVNAWLGSVSDGDLAGDLDGDGAVSPADIAAFVNAWLAALAGGC